VSAQPDDLEEVELSPEEHASLVSRHGKDVTVYDAGGRRWAFKKPTRAQWQKGTEESSSSCATRRPVRSPCVRVSGLGVAASIALMSSI
jgi:hypothetical protein